MVAVPPFSEATLEAICRLLGECGTGTQISDHFAECHLVDSSGESTKWRRLQAVFRESQTEARSANQVLGFIQNFFSPSRFIGKSEEFEESRTQLNAVLSFLGLEFGADGKFRECIQATNLTEAEGRLKALRSKLRGRLVHEEVTKYCETELLKENYFHAVFEASKGLTDRIRDLSGSGLDGARLIDAVFSVENPLLAFNTLTTEFEQSEHKGFAQLLKGCNAAVRNPLAHGPKILWGGEDDAADYLSLISLLHRKLDRCVPCQTL